MGHGGDRSSAVRACSTIVLSIPSGVSGPVRGRSARRAVIEVPPDAVVWIPDQRHRASIGAGRSGPVLVLRHWRVRRGGVHGCDFPGQGGHSAGWRIWAATGRFRATAGHCACQRVWPADTATIIAGGRRRRPTRAGGAGVGRPAGTASADPGMSHRTGRRPVPVKRTGAGCQRWKEAVSQADDGGRPTGFAPVLLSRLLPVSRLPLVGGGADRSGAMWRIAGPLGW